ncbi:dethiobiotin synthase [Haemophilus influenzae HK1212]|uniref:Dethiobiotin synthase n=1 Tax=Haemophilus influenzae HK1212 TaxID=456482 RepID=A0A7G2JXB5_HAEIF|nr:dethiobiotin synthase [Haemophilus influenzae HK1212]
MDKKKSQRIYWRLLVGVQYAVGQSAPDLSSVIFYRTLFCGGQTIRQLMGKVIFISGIDTDVGKTVATGIYAKKLMEQGFSVITQKMIQTGCKNIADDLLVHRKIQGIDLTEEDLQGKTCPYVFEYPCSPHLAAKRESRKISPTQRELGQYSVSFLNVTARLQNEHPIQPKNSDRLLPH